jgi:hypothetical protein
VSNDVWSIIIGAIVTITTAWIAAWQQVHLAQLKSLDAKVNAINGGVKEALTEVKTLESHLPQ